MHVMLKAIAKAYAEIMSNNAECFRNAQQKREREREREKHTHTQAQRGGKMCIPKSVYNGINGLKQLCACHIVNYQTCAYNTLYRIKMMH